MGKLRFRQVHMDFHTSEKIVSVGEAFDAKEFAKTLLDAGVDSITCFARCHHGMIYYMDTKFPCRHPGLKKDLLREQIDACHAVGIKVPIYITVGWDEFIAAKHPEWLERTPEGKPISAGPLQAGWKTLCFNNPYVDYVEENTVEVLEKFGKDVDGLFFDIIHQDPCCCTYCMKDMQEQGYDPEKLEDRRSFADNVLLNFRKRITDTIRKYNKTCTIFYNSGHVNSDIRKSLATYTHLELESLPSGAWGYEHFPITVRFAKLLGVEYLGMTGKFHNQWGDFGGYKSQAALEYECFTALANGAKCSVGDQLHPSGAINKATYDLIGSVYNQIREKEAWCDDAVPVSEIAVYTPEAIKTGHIELDPSTRGVHRMLTEEHYQFDIIDTENDFNRYKVIILPDKITLDAVLKKKLEAFIEKGGKVLLSYKSGMDRDEKGFELNGMGVGLVGPSEYSTEFIVAGNEIKQGLKDTEYALYERGLWVKPHTGAQTLADIWYPYFDRSYKHFCSHRQTPAERKGDYPAIVKNGSFIYFAHPIFSMYYKHGARVYRHLLINSLKLLLKDKLVETDAPTTANINLNYQPERKRHVVHILHYIPERRTETIDIIEDIIPLYNLTMKVVLPGKPSRVYTAPSGRALDFSWQNGCVKVVVPEVKGHEIIVFE